MEKQYIGAIIGFIAGYFSFDIVYKILSITETNPLPSAVLLTIIGFLIGNFMSNKKSTKNNYSSFPVNLGIRIFGLILVVIGGTMYTINPSVLGHIGKIIFYIGCVFMAIGGE